MFCPYIHLLQLSQWNADKSVPQSQKGTSPVSGTGLPVMTVALYVHSSTAVWCQHQRHGVGGVDSLGYDGLAQKPIMLCHLEAITYKVINYIS